MASLLDLLQDHVQLGDMHLPADRFKAEVPTAHVAGNWTFDFVPRALEMGGINTLSPGVTMPN